MKLIICEKPSVSRTIAQVVGANSSKDGYIEGNGYIVSWCIGHLLGLVNADAYNPAYKKWTKESLPIIPEEFKYESNIKTKKQLKTVISLIKNKEVSEIINATDAAREGELIFRLVYNHSKSKKPVKRLWISSLERNSILSGLATMKDQSFYDKLYQSALARQQADWLVGINGTRIFSLLYNGTLNIGRVMTPTLNMVVERHLAIQNFVSEPFYNVVLQLVSGTNQLTAKSERMTSKEETDALTQQVNQIKIAIVSKVESKQKSMRPPELYDLTSLQREANRLFGFTAQQTLNLAQNLYEKKLLTYPRTDSKYITTDMAKPTSQLAETMLGKLRFLTKVADQVDISHISNIVNNKKVSDHHAIIPTQTMFSADLKSLPKSELDLLSLVSARLMAAISTRQIYRETKIEFEVPGVEPKFTANGKVVLEPGFTLIEKCYRESLKLTKDSQKVDVDLPALKKGQQLSAEASTAEGFTSPPKPYTEDTLLLSMEKASVDVIEEEESTKLKTQLGTPATRAAIIEKLIKTGYMLRSKKLILPTDNGINLIKVVPGNIKTPALTAEWEAQLSQIADGQQDFEIFLDNIKKFTQKLVQENQNPIAGFEKLFPRQVYKKSKKR